MLDQFFEWFLRFMNTMLGGVGNAFQGLFLGLRAIFDFKTYFELFATFRSSFSVLEWILAILCFLLTYVIWFGLIFLLVLAVRKYIRFRKTLVGNEDLLEEIADLHRDVLRLTSRWERRDFPIRKSRTFTIRKIPPLLQRRPKNRNRKAQKKPYSNAFTVWQKWMKNILPMFRRSIART